MTRFLARAAFHLGTLAGVFFALTGCVESAHLLVPPQAYLFPAQTLSANWTGDNSSKPMNLVRTGQHYVLVANDAQSKNLIVDMMDAGDGYVLQVWERRGKGRGPHASSNPTPPRGSRCRCTKTRQRNAARAAGAIPGHQQQ